MKKYFILLFATLALNVNAQNDKCCETPECKKTEAGNVHMGKNPKAMLWKSVKEEDKEAFKALMKEYHAERKAVIEKNRGKKLEKGQKPTEEQMDAFMKQGYAKRKALLELEEKYYGKFRKFLAPPRQHRQLRVMVSIADITTARLSVAAIMAKNTSLARNTMMPSVALSATHVPIRRNVPIRKIAPRSRSVKPRKIALRNRSVKPRSRRTTEDV